MSPKSDSEFEKTREKSKENILSTALQLFSSNGFFNTSIRQIAKNANISNGLLYNYFSSKEDLLIEIINKSFNILDSVIDSNSELSAEKKIENTINKFFDLVENKQKLLRMMIQIGLQTEKFEFVNKMIAKKYIEEVQELSNSFKEIGVLENEVEASLFLATLDGVMIQSMIMKDSIPIMEMKRVLINKYSKK